VIDKADAFRTVTEPPAKAMKKAEK